MGSLFWVGICLILWAIWRKVHDRMQVNRDLKHMKDTTMHLMEVMYTKKIGKLTKLPKGWSYAAPILFCAIFGAGIIVGANWPSSPRYTYYGLYLSKVVSAKSWKLVSPATGPFTADFCDPVQQYEPKEGYVLCKFQYIDRGCMDVSSKKDGFWWVKDSSGKTVVMHDSDTYQSWPRCVKDDTLAEGGQ